MSKSTRNKAGRAPATTTMHVRVPEDLLIWLRDRAEAEHRGMSNTLVALAYSVMEGNRIEVQPNWDDSADDFAERCTIAATALRRPIVASFNDATTTVQPGETAAVVVKRLLSCFEQRRIDP